AGGTGNRTDSCVEIGGGQVRFFGFGDFFCLSTCQHTDFVEVGTSRAFLHTASLFDQDGGRRRLHDEGEALVCVGGNDYRNRQARFHALCLGIEGLAEFHDVQTAL